MSPQQAGELHTLFARHTVGMAALDRDEDQLRVQVRDALHDLSAAGIPGMSNVSYTRLLDIGNPLPLAPALLSPLPEFES